jgi:hypothetical protein
MHIALYGDCRPRGLRRKLEANKMPGIVACFSNEYSVGLLSGYVYKSSSLLVVRLFVSRLASLRGGSGRCLQHCVQF